MGLLSYRGVVNQGQIHLLEPVALPDGAQVVVVVQSPISPEEWTRAFDEFEGVATAHPPAEELSEETAQALIDEVRATRPA
jgi:hypothetical protein